MKIDQSLCRLCTKSFSNDNFETIDGTIRSKIQEVLRIETLLEDSICLFCRDNVDRFHSFFEEIHAAQSFFQNKAPELLPEIKIEEAIDDEFAKVFIKPVEQDTNEEEEVVASVKNYLEVKEDSSLDDDSEDEVSVKKQSKEELQNKRKINDFFDFVCHKCKSHHQTYRKYRKHMLRKHSEKRPTIQCCNDAIDTSYTSLLSHFYSHTHPDKLKCTACDRQYNSLTALAHHFKTIHAKRKKTREKKEDPKVFCPECGILLMKRCLATHMKIHQPRIKLQCDICKKFLQSRKAIIYHMTQQHLPKNPNLDQILCSICAKSFSSMDRFNHHLRYHHDNTTDKCPECNVVMRLENLRIHRKRVHEIKKVSCPICFKEFKNNERLRGHKIKVHVEPKYECDICQKKYKTKDKMQDHRSTHFNELRFKCDLCDHMNNDYGNMTKHRKTKHRDVPYPAPGTARKIFEIARH